MTAIIHSKQAQRLHQDLLLFEHPWTPSRDRAQVAERVCREARKLLEGEFDLHADFAQPEPDPEKADRKGGVIAAIGDFLKGRVRPGGKGRKPVEGRRR